MFKYIIVSSSVIIERFMADGGDDAIKYMFDNYGLDCNYELFCEVSL